MAAKLQGLAENAVKRTTEAKSQALDAINQMIAIGKKVNFSTVHKQSGVSKNFLYSNLDIRERIEELRAFEVDKEINQRAKNDKTSRSKDVLIATKDKRIAKLEAENRALKMELEYLRGLLYAGK